MPSRRFNRAKVVASRTKWALIVLTLVCAVWGVAIVAGPNDPSWPVVRELSDRVDRLSERFLPKETTHSRAMNSLEKRLDAEGLALGSPAFIRIFKRSAELELWLRKGARFERLGTYPICRFSGFPGPKLAEGDRQAPEGFYAVTSKQLNPASRHYRAFNIGFPNEYDRAWGRTGSALMVHGGCTSIGCYAMTDLGVAEIYAVVEAALNGGQGSVPVHIFPFRMTTTNMVNPPSQQWLSFWQQLQVGYEAFERDRVPPEVVVCDKRYVVNGNGQSCQAIAGW